MADQLRAPACLPAMTVPRSSNGRATMTPPMADQTIIRRRKLYEEIVVRIEARI